MAGPLILTGNKISFTYLRLIQTDGMGEFFDGSGDSVNLKEIYSQENAPTGTGTDAIQNGSLWYKTDTGVLYVYVTDTDSSQWVQPG